MIGLAVSSAVVDIGAHDRLGADAVMLQLDSGGA